MILLLICLVVSAQERGPVPSSVAGECADSEDKGAGERPTSRLGSTVELALVMESWPEGEGVRAIELALEVWAQELVV